MPSVPPVPHLKHQGLILILPASQNLCRLRILPPEARQVQARAPPRPVHARAGDPAEARPDQGASGVDAAGLFEGRRDGGDGHADQCVHREYLYVSFGRGEGNPSGEWWDEGRLNAGRRIFLSRAVGLRCSDCQSTFHTYRW